MVDQRGPCWTSSWGWGSWCSFHICCPSCLGNTYWLLFRPRFSASFWHRCAVHHLFSSHHLPLLWLCCLWWDKTGFCKGPGMASLIRCIFWSHGSPLSICLKAQIVRNRLTISLSYGLSFLVPAFFAFFTRSMNKRVHSLNHHCSPLWFEHGGYCRTCCFQRMKHCCELFYQYLHLLRPQSALSWGQSLAGSLSLV